MKKKLQITKEIPTQIKNLDLVEKRRSQIVDAAVKLFAKNGFHKTTTRQIAEAAKCSIGSLYEYVESKEDVLYLVCDSIHAEVEKGVSDAISRSKGGKNALSEIIREYILVCHKMSDFILLIYRETKSLPVKWQKKVLENELRITSIFIEVLKKFIESGELPKLDKSTIILIAHNISVLGHMWTFRRWFLSHNYTIEEYINLQTNFILGIT
ncbi:MAG: TetR/AcrR family transcriptional regulator [Desulfobacterales bacterium]|nr:TetR/AcrR family transcriptional regulator [Desulfobacterales bacterium]MBF0397570.1 TetR/AcrR family transcriptional regulator [Desulfobacterales bacterium]